MKLWWEKKSTNCNELRTNGDVKFWKKKFRQPISSWWGQKGTTATTKSFISLESWRIQLLWDIYLNISCFFLGFYSIFFASDFLTSLTSNSNIWEGTRVNIKVISGSCNISDTLKKNSMIVIAFKSKCEQVEKWCFFKKQSLFRGRVITEIVW